MLRRPAAVKTLFAFLKEQREFQDVRAAVLLKPRQLLETIGDLMESLIISAAAEGRILSLADEENSIVLDDATGAVYRDYQADIERIVAPLGPIRGFTSLMVFEDLGLWPPSDQLRQAMREYAARSDREDTTADEWMFAHMFHVAPIVEMGSLGTAWSMLIPRRIRQARKNLWRWLRRINRSMELKRLEKGLPLWVLVKVYGRRIEFVAEKFQIEPRSVQRIVSRFSRSLEIKAWPGRPRIGTSPVAVWERIVSEKYTENEPNKG